PALKPFDLVTFIFLATNAALRGECRLNQASADHFHHQNQPHTKNATRHESLLNALLWLGLKVFFTCLI
ncbi:hypothetical protein, partial [Vibrio parahaemolyticus]|uniref:hypothetical protein n=1 Tax=Vibrio parahaemolyticus TaxID=670 RepID=UPI003F5CC9B1